MIRSAVAFPRLQFRLGRCLSLPAMSLALSACAWDANTSPGSTTIASSPASVEAIWGGNCPIVTAFVNSHGPYRFLLDTGAESTFVSPACAREARLQLFEVDVRIDAAGASSAYLAQATKIPELRLDSARFTGVPALVADMERDLDGALGFPVFADVLLTLDGPRRQIVLEEGRLPSPAVDPAVLVLESDDVQYGSPEVRGRVAGHPARILIDSGFDGSLYLATSIPENYGLAFESEPSTGLVATHAGRREVARGTLRERVEVGALVFEEVPTMVGMGPPVILGGALLRRVVSTFDQQTRRVRLAGGSR